MLYVNFVVDGDAYHFLALVLLAPVAGLVLIANSLFCILRYPSFKSFWMSLLFVVLAVVGGIEAWYYVPQFRM